jgi:two-component system, NarL family, invasion response regulator UvrY
LKILIVDDHKILRQGLKEILSHLPDITLIDEAENGNEAISKAACSDYDLILLDISMPDSSGLEVLQTIVKKYPEQKVLILSMHAHEQYALRALKTGAYGYLTKDTASEELMIAVKKISSGVKYISPAIAENIAKYIGNDFTKPLHENLSEREFEIMLKIAAGKTLQDISAELFISGKTVSTYKSRLMTKMGMKKKSEIVHYCNQQGLLS